MFPQFKYIIFVLSKDKTRQDTNYEAPYETNNLHEARDKIHQSQEERRQHIRDDTRITIQAQHQTKKSCIKGEKLGTNQNRRPEKIRVKTRKDNINGYKAQVT